MLRSAASSLLGQEGRAAHDTDSYMVAGILCANLVEKDILLSICCNLHNLSGILMTHLYKWAYLKGI